ncbi:MAG: PEP-CTERM sorting domain-containing protein [Nitrospirales bacterium]|nr:PEP-CTERM sorting domain-containing protein [Nitrospira sp.]MDR4500888.1 PEP-CTERM sorting domain-containing protein [Nitrospirales bacterium]
MLRSSNRLNFLFFLLMTPVYCLPSLVWAIPIDQKVTIQPIQVCDNYFISCAPVGLLEAETDKIWSQAGIDVDFLSPTQFNRADFLVLNNIDEVIDLFRSPGHGNHPDNQVLNMWFVNDILGAYGFGELGGNGMAIRSDVFTLNMGAGGSFGTIAHEIGHNLGLTHASGLDDSLNLMTSYVRPTNINDIFPDGIMAAQLNLDQINTARHSRFSVDIMPQPIPEPSTILLFGTALTGLGFWRWNKGRPH